MVSEPKMREILFRGKRTDNGEWAYSRCPDGLLYSGVVGCDFIPETVGQYAGLTDKNGKRIFEGDILRYYDDEIQVVDWNSEWSQLMLHTYGDYERKRDRKTVKEKFEGWNHLTDYPLEDMPIIGNIHDNPELLEVSHA